MGVSMTNFRRCGMTALVAALGLLFTSLSASAYTNLTGVYLTNFDEDWPDRLPGPELGDYGGLPINDADRMRAETWDPSLLTLPEYQCRVHPSDYTVQFSEIRIWEVRDEVTQKLIAIRMHKEWQSTERFIWMDGRPHPPAYAEHTAMGFSTGKWEGDKLVVTTTHLREGYIRRNGVARSPKATVTEFFIKHGDNLNWSVYVDDPAYLTEPFFRNRDYTYSPDFQVAPYPCDTVEEIDRPAGVIPHYLPGKNPFLMEYAERRRIPFEAAMGGAQTMYPEYEHKMETLPLPKYFDPKAQRGK